MTNATPEVTSIPFVGGGPLNGHAWATVSGGGANFVHMQGADAASVAQGAVDCYRLTLEDGVRYLVYDREKGAARGYEDRTLEGTLYPAAASSAPRWVIQTAPASGDRVLEPEFLRDHGPYRAPCPLCGATAIKNASERTLRELSIGCPGCRHHIVGGNHPDAILRRV